MRILVTGGAGFIGSNFIYYLLANHSEDKVLCLDALTYAGNLSTLSEACAQPAFSFVKGDITDRETVYRIFDEYRPDVVVNFAAESHVDRSILHPDLFLHTNVNGVGVLLDASKAYKVGRFHQISTDEVYGDLPLDDERTFVETDLLRPSSPYSAGKAAADLLTLSYHRTYGMDVTISRCSNNFGRFQFPEKLIPLVITRALADQPVPVYGDGSNVRDWLYVEDQCSAIDLIIRRGKSGEIYNIGDHNEHSNIDVVRKVLSIMGKPESLITYVQDRPGHDVRYAVNADKLKNELGWSARTNYGDGLRKTVEWYLNNADWWRGLIDQKS